MLRSLIFFFTIGLVLSSCEPVSRGENQRGVKDFNSKLNPQAQELVDETLRSWNAYKKYAWGHDALAPLSEGYRDWYDEPLYISPIDAYSTLKVMGLEEEAAEIEAYVVDSLDFNKDLDAKIFEVNIRILGGLLAMYDLSQNPKVLSKARDFADRMLPAFDTPTGIPRYWVNLKTGESRGDTVNVAEAGTYTFEMGVLSYYTRDPKYYQAGKKATRAIFQRRSGELELIGDVIDVQSGKWVSTQSHICAGVDSYYEYLYKSFLLFGDPELKEIWDQSVPQLHNYLSETHEGKLWYGRADMYSGEKMNSVVTLYDAFFPAILSLSGDTVRAVYLQNTWNWLWQHYGLEPMVYDYGKDSIVYPAYDLNPEIMESAYYLFNITGDSTYYEMNLAFWEDLKSYCRTEIAFTSIENVSTKKQKDYMPTFFFAETLKYLFLTFTGETHPFVFEDYLFTTEAHPFRRDHFKREKAKEYLGY
jgi:hypothetical protein